MGTPILGSTRPSQSVGPHSSHLTSVDLPGLGNHACNLMPILKTGLRVSEGGTSYFLILEHGWTTIKINCSNSNKGMEFDSLRGYLVLTY